MRYRDKLYNQTGNAFIDNLYSSLDPEEETVESAPTVNPFDFTDAERGLTDDFNFSQYSEQTNSMLEGDFYEPSSTGAPITEDQFQSSIISEFGSDQEKQTYQGVKDYYGEEAAKKYVQADYNRKYGLDMNKANDFYNYLTQQSGGNKVLAAAILGNIAQESALNPNTIHDNNTGYGLAGHRLDRRDKLLNFIKGSDKPEEYAQLDFILKELQEDYPNTYRKILQTTDVNEATDIFMKEFERPHKDYARADRRRQYANAVFRKLGGPIKAQTGFNADHFLGRTHSINYDPSQEQYNLMRESYAEKLGMPIDSAQSFPIDGGLFNQDKIQYSHSKFNPESLNSPEMALANEAKDRIDKGVSGAIDTVRAIGETVQDVSSLIGRGISHAAGATSILLDDIAANEQYYDELEGLYREKQSDYNPLRNFQNRRKTVL